MTKGGGGAQCPRPADPAPYRHLYTGAVASRLSPPPPQMPPVPHQTLKGLRLPASPSCRIGAIMPLPGLRFVCEYLRFVSYERAAYTLPTSPPAHLFFQLKQSRFEMLR